MDPRVAFYLFDKNGIAVHWYGIIIATALIVAVALGSFEAKKRGYRSELVLDLMLLGIPLGIAFARLFYVVFYDYAAAGLLQNPYFANPLRIVFIWEGGLAIYGAVAGGALAAFIFSKWRKISFGELIDIAAPSLILAQGIGRWGNFVNQEAYGALITDPSWQWFPAAVPIAGQWHMATFFYEFVWNILVFVTLILIRKKIKVRGGVFALYGMLYGVGRFFIESLRTDSLMLGSFRVSQLVSVALIAGGILYLAIMSRKQKPLPAYDGFYSISWTSEQIEAYKAGKKKGKTQDGADSQEPGDESGGTAPDEKES